MGGGGVGEGVGDGGAGDDEVGVELGGLVERRRGRPLEAFYELLGMDHAAMKMKMKMMMMICALTHSAVGGKEKDGEYV